MSLAEQTVAQRLSAADANERFAAGQASAYALEPKLARQYEASLLATGRRCVAAYRARTQVLTAAMPPKPEGTPQNISQPPQPTVDEVLDAALAAASAEARTLATRRRVSAAVAGEILGGFGSIPELRPLLEPMVRSQAGAQAERLVAGTRDAVANVLLDALVEGWSVDVTAEYLGAVLKEQAKWRATMLARTDLIALSNGAAQDAVLVLGSEGPQFKTWLSAGDERVRQSHQDANRETVGVGEPFNVGGAMLQYPGDPLGPDDETINCRCVHVFSDTAMPTLRHSFEGGNLMSDQLAVAASANNEEEYDARGSHGERAGVPVTSDLSPADGQAGGRTGVDAIPGFEDQRGEDEGAEGRTDARLGSELDALLAAFDPSKHPHRPKGRGGGQWARAAEVAAEAAGDGVVMDVTETDDVLKLNRIVSEHHGEGNASEALDELVEYADEAGKPVFLNPSSLGGLTQEQLVAWYRRHGFAPIGKAMVHETVVAAVDFTDGSMIALYPRPEHAQALAALGDQPAEDLHVTLAFLPEGMTDEQAEALSAFLAPLANRAALEGKVGGVGVFASGDNGHPIIALPSVEGLNELRAGVVGALAACGIPYSKDYGFVPHLTLSYSAEPRFLPEAVGQPLTFAGISAVRGPVRQDFMFRPSDAAVVAAVQPFLSDVERGVELA